MLFDVKLQYRTMPESSNLETDSFSKNPFLLMLLAQVSTNRKVALMHRTSRLMQTLEALADINKAPTILYFLPKCTTAYIPQWLEKKMTFLLVSRPERHLLQSAGAYVDQGLISTSWNILDMRGSSSARAKGPSMPHQVQFRKSCDVLDSI